MLPVVALVGRPNVGKSTLFNHLIGYRMAIVEDTPGVTRDRLYANTEWTGIGFSLIDTGGIQMDENEDFMSDVRHQAELAVEEADVILMIVDGREGLTALDRDVAELLRARNKEVLVVVNKIDAEKYENNIYDFYALGFSKVLSISAANAFGIGDLLDEIVAALPVHIESPYDDTVIKVAIVGKPNVGKSSLTNRILGTERVIVSDIPGTTRDAIDSFLEYNGEAFVIIDTAGLRRKSRVKESIEKYSVSRTLRAVDRSDVVLIVIDGTDGVTEQDKRIAGYAHEKGKGCILVVNKWDIVEKDHRTMDTYKKIMYSELPFLQYAPVVFISALTGQRVHRVLELVKFVSDQQNMRISTSMLNTLLEEATLRNPPPSDKGRRLKIFYGAQVGIRPPTFVLFVNDNELMHFSYLRYLENNMREIYGYEGTPIWFKVKPRKTGGTGR